MVSIRVLSTETEKAYDALVSGADMGMLYHSIKYRNFLREILEGARDSYLLAFEEGQLTAAIPVFIKEGALGTVVNSLPFYGSHGSIVYSSVASQAAKTGLLDAFDRLCLEKEAVTSTIISNPVDTDLSFLESYSADLNDERIGQITPLPNDNADNVTDLLMESFHQKTRNMVRKGAKAGFSVSHNDSEVALRALHSIHDENIRGVGGTPKTWGMFQTLAKTFEYDKDYRVYIAKNSEGEIVSSLLIFFFRGMVEYYTPATLEEYRSQQPLSFLIHTAMKDSVIEKGARYWNWGGTWLDQIGLYRFKSRWGAKDYRYDYYIKVYDKKVLSQFNSESIKGWPHFYVVPYSTFKK